MINYYKYLLLKRNAIELRKTIIKFIFKIFQLIFVYEFRCQAGMLFVCGWSSTGSRVEGSWRIAVKVNRVKHLHLTRCEMAAD